MREYGRSLTKNGNRESVLELKKLHPHWALDRIAKFLNLSENFVRETLAGDEVRREVLRSTPLSDSHLSEIRSAPRELWSDLVRVAEQRRWSRNEVGDVVREIKNEAIPAERKQALLDGKAEPLTEKDGEPAVRRETLERVAAEAISKSSGVALYRVLWRLGVLKLSDPKDLLDCLDKNKVQKLVDKLPECIEFFEQLLNIGRERLELCEM